jgi:hypothetical protein
MTSTGRYILTWSQDSFAVHGPFASERHALAYGQWWQANCGDRSGDDPRWQTIDLADPTAPPRLVTPDPALWHGDCYGTFRPEDYFDGTWSDDEERRVQ